MTTKKLTSKPPTKKPAREFTARLDGTRSAMLDELMQKKGVGQNGIVSIAISEMHEREFANRKE